MTAYVIGDTHFNHKNILKYANEYRPFASLDEHNEELISRWNSAVSEDDVVYHLGDFALGYKTNPGDYLSRLNGTKYLVAGNHDVYWSTQEWLDWGFKEVFGSMEYGGYILTHIPVHESQQGRWKGNIHGHMHFNSVDDPWYYCASAEQIDLTPVNIDIVMKDLRKYV